MRVLRASAIAAAVRVTLGPKSRCVLIEKKGGSADPEENLGAQMLRGAAERTSDAAGDGTTTVTAPSRRQIEVGKCLQ